MPASSKPKNKLHDFEGLTDEEMQFCWMSLVEQTQLTAEKLQEFMMVVAGEHISVVQARDLLKYMDANEDGVVGRDDFKNFMSTARLEDTNPKDFMWTPKRTYREEHGRDRQRAEDDGGGHSLSLFGDPRGDGHSNSSEPRRISLEVPTMDAGNVAGGSSGTRSNDGGKTVEPRPPHGSKPKRGSQNRPSRAEAARLHNEAIAAMSTPSNSRPSTTATGKPEHKGVKVDDKLRQQIDVSISKYEQESWQKFLHLEEQAREKLFAQFAANPEDGMTSSEYHQVLRKWHKLAKWSMPGDVRPADSLAAFKFLLHAETRRAREEQAAAGEGPAGEEKGATAAPAVEDKELGPDARLTFKLWTDMMNGKYRPAEDSGK